MVSLLLLGLVPIILLSPICDGGLAQLRRAVTHFFNPYGYVVDFGWPMNNFKFAYVIIRTGFRAPDNTASNTFPSDKNYLTGRWKRGQLTRTGGKLVEMLGRSMKETRYGLVMERWTEKSGPIRISSLKKEYAKTSVERFEEGYLKENRERFHIAHYSEASFDKSDVFEDSTRCLAYNTLWNNVKKVQEKPFIEKPENQQFLSELRKYIGEDINPGGEWHICSLEHVYWLWDILEFERVTRNRTPKWLTKEVRKRIDEFVHEYLKESIHGDERMAKYLVGPLLNNIIDKDSDGYTRLHAHVTDERLFSAFKSLLTGAAATTAEYGETIMFDVDFNGNVEVLNYYPVSNIYTKLPVPFTTFDKFKTVYSNLLIRDDQWNKACKSQPDYSSTATAKGGAGLGHASQWKAPTLNGASYENPNREYDKDNTQPRVPDQGSYQGFPPRWDQSMSTNSSPSQPRLPNYSQSGTTRAHADSEAPLNNMESPSKIFGWYTETYKKEEYITRTQYFEMANTDEENGETSTKKNKHAVRPVLAEYTPWRPHGKEDLANSSEDDDSFKPNNAAALDSSLTSKPRNGGTGAYGFGANYSPGNGEYKPYGETGIGGSKPLKEKDLRGMRSDTGNSLDGSPPRGDSASSGLGSFTKTGSGGLDSYTGSDVTSTGTFDKSGSGPPVPYSRQSPYENSQQKSGAREPWSYGRIDSDRQRSLRGSDHRGLRSNNRFDQVPAEKPTDVISSASLRHLHVDLPDIDEFEKMLPKRGDKVYATGIGDTTDKYY